MKTILIFNKLSGAYIGSTHGAFDGKEVDTAQLNTTYMKYKVVDFNPDTEEWQGDFDNGKIVPIESQPEICESQLDVQAQNKIFSRYRYYHQINVLAQAIEALAGCLDRVAAHCDNAALKIPFEAREELAEMREYIAAILANNARYKDFYTESEDYRYFDKSSEAQRLGAQLEGGLHEVFGQQKKGEII